MKNFYNFLLAILLMPVTSCWQGGEPALHTYVTFINESRHIISVDIENTAGSWCKIDDFILEPGNQCEFDYEELGILIEKAIVKYDNEVTILHELNSDIEQNEFRNICKYDSPWWEVRHEGKEHSIAYCTFRFTDADYDYASRYGG